MQVFEDNVLVLKEKGVKKMSPFTVPYMLAWAYTCPLFGST
jgi:hypothetical protein